MFSYLEKGMIAKDENVEAKDEAPNSEESQPSMTEIADDESIKEGLSP